MPTWHANSTRRASTTFRRSATSAATRARKETSASLGGLRGQARAKENIGLLSLTADDAAEAVAWLTAARDLAREVGDELEVGRATRSLAAAMIELGEAAEATTLLAESLGIVRELGDTHGI